MVEGAMLQLLKMWLETLVEETDRTQSGGKVEVLRICVQIREVTGRNTTLPDQATVVAKLAGKGGGPSH
jgi:hypothetical protein